MHRHGIVLAKPFFRSLLIAAAGVGCILAPWRLAGVAGVALLALAAFLVVVAVARWDRTHLEVTGAGMTVVHGVLHRTTVSVTFEPGRPVEVERSLLGRILGYGTVVAGELEVDAVPRRLHEHVFGG